MMQLSDRRGQIGRMAVLEGYRKKGIGTELLQALIERGKSSGIKEFELHAQVLVIPFYEKLGFQSHGEIYDEAGIPHRNMILLLK
jgi:GNAT superfamily N-acetyltransferase